MKKLALSFLLLCACQSSATSYTPREVCDTDLMAPFIIECVSSVGEFPDDETPEQIVRQCESTASSLYCTADCEMFGDDLRCEREGAGPKRVEYQVSAEARVELE